MIWVQPALWSSYCTLDKTLWNDYFCSESSKKQQIEWTRIRKNPQKQNESLETSKQMRIPPSTKNIYRSKKCADHLNQLEQSS